MTDRPTYHARIWRDPDDDAWLVACIEEKRAHSYGRSLAEARANAREVIGLWFHHDSDDSAYQVVYDVEVGDESTRELVDRVRRDRAELAKVQTRATAELAEAARRLTDAGLTYRDTADLLGVSHQRIGQLLAVTRAAG